MRLNAIYIVWYRDVKGYSKRGIRMIGSLVQPLVYLIGLGLGLSLVFQEIGFESYLSFLAPGIIIQAILVSALFVGHDLIMDRQFGYVNYLPLKRQASFF